MTFDPPFPPIRAARRRPVLVAAALLLPAAAIPAQWSANPLKNTFVDATCQVPPPSFPLGALALEPVLVPCNRGCFYAWVDAPGAVNIQVIDDCGYRRLASPFVIAGTSNGGLLHFTQLAGCAYANNDGAQNQLFLAYTALGTGGFE